MSQTRRSRVLAVLRHWIQVEAFLRTVEGTAYVMSTGRVQHFDVVRAREAAEAMLREATEVDDVFRDWTRSLGRGPESGESGWPGSLARRRDNPCPTWAPMARYRIRLAKRVLAAIEGIPADCEDCGGSGFRGQGTATVHRATVRRGEDWAELTLPVSANGCEFVQLLTLVSDTGDREVADVSAWFSGEGVEIRLTNMTTGGALTRTLAAVDHATGCEFKAFTLPGVMCLEFRPLPRKCMTCFGRGNTTRAELPDVDWSPAIRRAAAESSRGTRRGAYRWVAHHLEAAYDAGRQHGWALRHMDGESGPTWTASTRVGDRGTHRVHTTPDERDAVLRGDCPRGPLSHRLNGEWAPMESMSTRRNLETTTYRPGYRDACAPRWRTGELRNLGRQRTNRTRT